MAPRGKPGAIRLQRVPRTMVEGTLVEGLLLLATSKIEAREPKPMAYDP